MNYAKPLKLIPVAALALIAGCSSIQESQDFQSFDAVSNQVRDFDRNQRQALSARPIVEDIDGIYLGSGRTISRVERNTIPSSLDKHIALFDSVPLSALEIAARVEEATGMPIKIRGARKSVTGGGGQATFTAPSFSSSPDDALVNLLNGGMSTGVSATSSGGMVLRFEGRISTLMDRVANHFDLAWRYSDGEIILSHESTETYELAMIAGAATYASNITASGGLSTQYSADVNQWEAIESLLDEALKDRGSYAINQATSSVIVTASPSTHAQLRDFIDSYNDVLTRQVALNVSVFTLNMDDSKSMGFDLNTIYQNMSRHYNLELAGPPLGRLNASEFTAQLLTSSSSRFAGSEAVLQALAEWGDTSIVTSTTGIVLNGQVFPIQDVNRRTYLAKTELNVTEGAGTTLALTPGEVITGFSMQVVPQIMSQDRLLLQYAFTLSSLKGMVELSSGDQTIQGPDVDDRSFTQRTLMPMGSTLVIAGFQRDEDSTTRRAGMGGGSRKASKGKTMVFVTITANKG